MESRKILTVKKGSWHYLLAKVLDDLWGSDITLSRDGCSYRRGLGIGVFFTAMPVFMAIGIFAIVFPPKEPFLSAFSVLTPIYGIATLIELIVLWENMSENKKRPVQRVLGPIAKVLDRAFARWDRARLVVDRTIDELLSPLGTLIDYLWERIHARRMASRQQKPKAIKAERQKQPNLFFLWIKAKKERYCPLIEFVP
ncbi:MAG: hypothetical protein HYW70_02220 [Candidatus Nealsonbacteria bacterium]|nr:hypothetical protein [Candidatus Nealsonbacteria bacterium]